MDNDGVALKSTTHPAGPQVPDDADINSGSLMTTEITLTRYAKACEQVTCENGHPICKFVVDVYEGQIQDLPRELGNWTQVSPEIGQIPIPGCAICGSGFTDGSIFHFEDGWRYSRSRPLKVSR